MDAVFLRGLEVQTHIGLHQWEQRLTRTLVVDAELEVDVRAAAESDAIADAIDYHAVAESLREVAGAHHCKLLETLADTMARALLQRFPAQRLKLTIVKPGAVAAAKAVGVSIERTPADYE